MEIKTNINSSININAAALVVVFYDNVLSNWEGVSNNHYGIVISGDPYESAQKIAYYARHAATSRPPLKNIRVMPLNKALKLPSYNIMNGFYIAGVDSIPE